MTSCFVSNGPKVVMRQSRTSTNKRSGNSTGAKFQQEKCEHLLRFLELNITFLWVSQILSGKSTQQVSIHRSIDHEVP